MNQKVLETYYKTLLNEKLLRSIIVRANIKPGFEGEKALYKKLMNKIETGNFKALEDEVIKALKEMYPSEEKQFKQIIRKVKRQVAQDLKEVKELKKKVIIYCFAILFVTLTVLILVSKKYAGTYNPLKGIPKILSSGNKKAIALLVVSALLAIVSLFILRKYYRSNKFKIYRDFLKYLNKHVQEPLRRE